MIKTIDLLNFADFYQKSHECMSIDDFEDMLRRNGLYSADESLADRLIKDGYLGRNRRGEILPQVCYFHEGIFAVKTDRVINLGITNEYKEAVITGKGQIYFVNRFLRQLN